MAKVKILEEYCKGCQLCVKACPKNILGIGKETNAKGYQYAQVIKEGCIGCKFCAVSCPDAAIEVYK